MAFKQIEKHLWLSLMVESKAIGNSYCIQYLVKKDSKKRKVISHSDREYKRIWNDIIKELPDLPPELRHEWIEVRFSKMTKWTSPHHGPYRIMIEWGGTPIGRLGKAYESYIEKQDVSREHKSRIYKHIKLIVDKSGSKTKLTTQTIQECIDHLYDKDDAKSISYIKAFVAIAKKFAKHSRMKGVDDIFNGVTIPTKDRGTKKGRQHFERDEVIKLIKRYINEDNVTAKSSFFFQLWTGARPSESYNAKVTPTSIVRSINKTKDKGVSQIVMKRTPMFNAYMLLTGIDFSDVPERKQNEVSKLFQQHCAEAGLFKEHPNIDRYWIRHTALTWMVNSIGVNLTMKDVEEMAGHANIRMLAGHYAKNMVTDKRSWMEAMPLNMKNIEHGYHGFILEAVMLAMFPQLANGKRPSDKLFDSALSIINQGKIERAVLNF